MNKVNERELEHRIDTLKFLDPETFEKYEVIARRRLREIMEGLEGKFSPPEEYAERVLKKWCLNFLVFLILQGGGQRPQVYACIKAPELTDLVRMDGQQRTNGHFSLITGTEKRARPSSAPRFTPPEICFKYVEYHAKFVRPYLIGKRARTDPRDQECLLLDTRTACNLNRNQITKTLKSFIRPKDPELGAAITTMDVRSSFATIKLMEYKNAVSKGETNQSREVFMESLANVMNTSVDMLNSVYFSIDDSEYLVAATNVYRFVRKEQGEEQDYY